MAQIIIGTPVPSKRKRRLLAVSVGESGGSKAGLAGVAWLAGELSAWIGPTYEGARARKTASKLEQVDLLLGMVADEVDCGPARS